MSSVLFPLALALAWDSFFASLPMGTLRLSLQQRIRIALAFGLCDAAALLMGFALSQPLVQSIGQWSGPIAPLLLGGYGFYVVSVARRCEMGADLPGHNYLILLGVPLSLSLDNLIAGLTVGLQQFPLGFSAAVIGTASALLSFAALQLSGTLRRLGAERAESLGGVLLVVLAVALAVER